MESEMDYAKPESEEQSEAYTGVDLNYADDPMRLGISTAEALSRCIALRRRKELLNGRILDAQRMCNAAQDKSREVQAMLVATVGKRVTIPTSRIKPKAIITQPNKHHPDPLFNRCLTAAAVARELKETTQNILGTLKAQCESAKTAVSVSTNRI